MMLPIKISIRFFILLTLVFSRCVIADSIPERPLNPYTYYSQNKQFALKVVPSDRRGFGSAEYLLTQNGTVVLHKNLPFTLRKAAVSNKGDIAGYSYSETDKDYKSQMHLWILSEQGKVNFDKSYEQHRGIIDGPRLPFARDVFIHSFNQTATFIVYDKDINPNWISYSLSTGKEISSIFTPFETYHDTIQKIITSEFNSYSLIAISHRIEKGDDWHSDEEFCLLDSMWEKKECKTYPNEFSKATSFIRYKQLGRVIDRNQYMGFTKDNKFWVTTFSKQMQDFFEIHHSIISHQINVTQLDSKPITINVDNEPIVKVTRQLTALADRSLPASILNGKESFKVINMAFDEFNRKAVISSKNGIFYFERYDNNNKKIFSDSLRIDNAAFMAEDLLYYKNNQWLWFLKRYNEQPKLVLLSNKGELIREIKIDAPGATHITNIKNDIIYILSSRLNEPALLTKLNIETGDVIFRKKLKNYYDHGLVITHDQKIAVFGTSGDIDFYSTSGNYLESFNIGKIANIKNTYLTEMQVNSQGLLYIFDFSSHQLMVFDGNKLHTKSIITRSDGKQLEHIYFMKFDLKNNLWVSNENGSFIRIDESGKEKNNLNKITATQPSQINWIYADKDENIFIFDNSQYLLARIDKNGTVKNIYQTPAADQASLTSIDHVIWKTQNGFLIKEKNKYVHVNEDGKQLSDFPLVCERQCSSIIPFVRSKGYWQEQYEEINFLPGGNSAQALSIKKDKNENWLELMGRINQNENDWLLTLSWQKLIAIDASGKVQATFPLNDYSIAWAQVSGNFVYVTTYKNDLINVYDLSGALIASTKTQNTKFNHSVPSVLYASGANKKLYVLSENAIKVYQLLEK